ncbi:MAG TPA: response regulator [Gammaproteobacteria bacterium]|nr:response regulator [Gammaproteobacteria bacterium]
MTTPVLICDDSSFARKQMARALPRNWDIEVSYAANGAEALDLIRKGKGDILFLDLNMPVMDGYQTLEGILKEDLPTLSIVVSGDIQPEAMQRVKKLGALEFIKKPVDGEHIDRILSRYGISIGQSSDVDISHDASEEIDLDDSYQELANVAMGRAADLLARLLDAFVVMPVPNVKHLEINELEMAMQHIKSDDSIAAVCQGFIGSGVAGEALLIFNETSYADIAQLMKYDGEVDETAQLELLMDISSVLCNACLNGISDQLDIKFSLGHPMVIGQHIHFDDILSGSATQWKQILTIEMGYKIENRNINCDLLLLITEDSIDSLNERVSHLLE